MDKHPDHACWETDPMGRRQQLCVVSFTPLGHLDHCSAVEIGTGPESQTRVAQKRTSQRKRPNLDKLNERGVKQ